MIINLRKILICCGVTLKRQNTYRSKYTSSKLLDIDIKNMSEQNLVKELQKIRREKRCKTEKWAPSKVTLQVVGSGARGCPSSLYVSTDHNKYFFNCGEGTQRLANEGHLKLTRLDHIFFTSATWKNMGGLPGTTLTIQDAGVPSITLHGPDGMTDLFATIRRFVLLNNLSVVEAKCDDNTIFDDKCMTVKYVHLKKNDKINNCQSLSTENHDTSNSYDGCAEELDNTDYYAHEINKNGKRNVLIQKTLKTNQNNMKKYHEFNRITGCISYICKLKPKPGALDLEKCLQAGVSPGPLLGLLKNGENVTLPDGKIVLSSDVCDPAIPGPVFIVVECPDESYLDSLIEKETFKEHQSNGNDPANYVVHFSPVNIIENDKYKKWMNKFPSTAEHIVINEKNNGYNLEGANKIQHKLHLLDPKIFPILKDNEVNKDLEMKMKQDKDEESNLKIYQAKAGTAVHLRPLDGLDKSGEIKIDPEAEVREAFNEDGFLDALAQLQTELNNKYKNSIVNLDYPKVLMLGTGSSIPNKTRNTSGILLQIDEETSVLMDCGEGTLGQIIRFFGKNKSDHVLKSIKAIYVSHLHADHHIGLLGVLQERSKFNQEPVYLLAPMQILSWLRQYHNMFEKTEHYYTLVSNQGLILNNKTFTDDNMNELRSKLKLKDVSTVDVDHCLHAFGVAFTLLNGQTIVYSGDTKPCLNLVNLGQDCHLLIHEATMENGMEVDAARKMHSTIGQAIEIGQQMNAKFTLLTHFSQRYSKMALLPENTADNVGLAYDNMHLSLSQLPLLPLFYPVIKIMFSEFYSSLQTKTEKKIKRKNLFL